VKDPENVCSLNADSGNFGPCSGYRVVEVLVTAFKNEIFSESFVAKKRLLRTTIYKRKQAVSP